MNAYLKYKCFKFILFSVCINYTREWNVQIYIIYALFIWSLWHVRGQQTYPWVQLSLRSTTVLILLFRFPGSHYFQCFTLTVWSKCRKSAWKFLVLFVYDVSRREAKTGSHRLFVYDVSSPRGESWFPPFCLYALPGNFKTNISWHRINHRTG